MLYNLFWRTFYIISFNFMGKYIINVYIPYMYNIYINNYQKQTI